MEARWLKTPGVLNRTAAGTTIGSADRHTTKTPTVRALECRFMMHDQMPTGVFCTEHPTTARSPPQTDTSTSCNLGRQAAATMRHRASPLAEPLSGQQERMRVSWCDSLARQSLVPKRVTGNRGPSRLVRWPFVSPTLPLPHGWCLPLHWRCWNFGSGAGAGGGCCRPEQADAVSWKRDLPVGGIRVPRLLFPVSKIPSHHCDSDSTCGPLISCALRGASLPGLISITEDHGEEASMPIGSGGACVTTLT